MSQNRLAPLIRGINYRRNFEAQAWNRTGGLYDRDEQEMAFRTRDLVHDVVGQFMTREEHQSALGILYDSYRPSRR